MRLRCLVQDQPLVCSFMYKIELEFSIFRSRPHPLPLAKFHFIFFIFFNPSLTLCIFPSQEIVFQVFLREEGGIVGTMLLLP